MNLQFWTEVLLTFLDWYSRLDSFGKSWWSCIRTATYNFCSLREITGFDIDSINHLRLFVRCGGWVTILIGVVVGIVRVCIRVGFDSRCMSIVIFSPWTENCISSMCAIFGSILFRGVYFVIWWWWYCICIIRRTGDFCNWRRRVVIVIGNSCTWGMHSLYSFYPWRIISLYRLLIIITYCLIAKISSTDTIVIIVSYNSRCGIIPIFISKISGIILCYSCTMIISHFSDTSNRSTIITYNLSWSTSIMIIVVIYYIMNFPLCRDRLSWLKILIVNTVWWWWYFYYIGLYVIEWFYYLVLVLCTALLFMLCTLLLLL